MASSNPAATRYARQYCGKYPTLSTRMLAALMVKELPAVFLNTETARSAIRTHRGLRANNQASQPLPFTPLALPDSDAKPVTPIAFTPTGKGAIFADVHLPYHDRKALEVAIGYCREHGYTDYWLGLGDILDCYQLSSFEKDPTARCFKSEMEAAVQLFRVLCQTFKQVWWKRGNHEYRYERYILQRAPSLWSFRSATFEALFNDVAEEMGCKAEVAGVKHIPHNVAIEIGEHLTAVHGHEYGRGIQSPVNPARGMFNKAKASTVSGHQHRISNHGEKDIRDNTFSCWSVGCLCDVHPEYAALNQWEQGFALLDFDGDQFELTNKKIIHGRVY